ncbi:related to nitrate transporter CrnA [Cephalotrichum gorgonifer]|uniref:Related to nitrate transporter CrnA n=1 Tax=Cephalotrichum gorgonifer TaxID=2041049 RepID=A0AAE8ST57_9PEZI|nr:related to nitrate transporter CrnA [Cephalotrichum gorgonifer]
MTSNKFRYLIGPPAVNPVSRKARSIPVLNPLDRYGRVFFFSWLGFMVAFLSWFAFPPLLILSIRDDLHMTQTEVATSNIVALVATLLVRLVAGSLCDRYGPRYVFAGLLFCGSIPTALVPTLKNANGLIAIRFFVGILGGTLVPCQVWCTGFFDKNVIGTANALAGGWGTSGGGITYFVMPAVVDSLVQARGLTPHVAWRVAFVVPFILINAVAASILLFCDDTPTGPWSGRHVVIDGGPPTPPPEAVNPHTENTKDIEKAATKPTGPESSETVEQANMEIIKAPGFLSALRIIFSPQSIALAAPYACSFGSELAINSIIGSYYYTHFPELGQTRAGRWAAMFALLNIVFRPTGGIVSDIIYKHTGSVWCKKLWLSFLGVMVGVFELAIGLSDPPREQLMFGLIAGLAFFIDSCNGASFAVVPHVFPSANATMQLRFTLAALSAMAPAANARIYGIAIPETIKAGDEITAIIASSNYIQSVYDVAIAFGISPAAAAYPDSLGTVLDSFYLGPEKSNSLKNLTEVITFPDSLKEGDHVVSASLMSLYGATSGPTLTNYNVTIQIGDKTSDTYVSSWEQN